ncbi:hypothetical protein DFJ73DRAFT_891664 [Zopfochytrium polystomum]|nr:hypothetical protein DFJ73DRAFT_891664 [Zopfochytrium polystomum]
MKKETEMKSARRLHDAGKTKKKTRKSGVGSGGGSTSNAEVTGSEGAKLRRPKPDGNKSSGVGKTSPSQSDKSIISRPAKLEKMPSVPTLLGSGGVLPKISGKSKDPGSSMPLALNNRTASRVLEQLAIVLADPALAVARAAEDTVPPESSNPTTTYSAPASRRQSVVQPTLPRYTSDISLQSTNSGRNVETIACEKELRRKVGKLCLELKRLLDKDGMTAAESSTFNCLFSKTSPLCGVAILLKCLRLVTDLDISVITTNILLRVINTHDGGVMQTTLMARKNGALSLVRSFIGLVSQGLPIPTNPLGGPSRFDEALSNTLQILLRVAKYDPKFPIIARVNGFIEPFLDTMRRWIERKDPALILPAIQCARQLAAKNDSNVTILSRNGIVTQMGVVLRSFSLSSTKELAPFEAGLDLLTLCCRHEPTAEIALRNLGVKFFLDTFSGSFGNEVIQKLTLKLLRALIDHDVGKQAFAQAEGPEILTNALENLIEHNESILSSGSQSGIASALIILLRAAVSEVDLPFVERIKPRVFSMAGGASDVGCFDSPQLLLSSSDSGDSVPVSIAASMLVHSKNPKRGRTAGIVRTPSSAGIKLEDTQPSSQDLEQFCPELDSEPPPPTPLSQLSSSLSRNSPKAFPPTSLSISGAPCLLARPPEAYLPSISLHENSTQGIALNRRESHGKREVSDEFPWLGPNRREPEPQLRKSTAALRKNIFEQTARILRPSAYTSFLVYDAMDETVRSNAVQQNPSILIFESRFESGNLQLAIQVGDHEYDLILQSDIGAAPGRHNQWFFFSVGNMDTERYKFNIINMTKGTSQFGEGMQPVVLSSVDGIWRRLGDSVCFARNHYRRVPDWKREASPASLLKVPRTPPHFTSTYSTLSFCLTGSRGDTLFVAYHYPYTYSDLCRFLDCIQQQGGADYSESVTSSDSQNCVAFDERCRRQTLCKSEGGNDVELLTITAWDKESIKQFPISERTYIFLTSRVHPGESNSSYIMQGAIQFLVGSDCVAVELRRRFVFKVVPMLNPDGVINGSHRCGLAGTDLNRHWKSPCRTKSPSIFWTKMLWKYIVEKGHRPLIACDFHGHSKRKNVFLFGCENGQGPNDGLERIFASLMATTSPVFDSNSCKYTVEKSKEATARVVLWREMGVVGSYTLESSYCGADFGEKKGLQFQIADLERVGVDFCCAIWAAYGVFNGTVPVAQPPMQVRRDPMADEGSSDDTVDV